MSIDNEGEWKEWFDKPTIAIKALNGDALSAIQLKCLHCCCGSQALVRDCKAYSCPLWSFRPYRTSNNEQRPVNDNIATIQDFHNKKDNAPEFTPPKIEKKRRKRRTKLEMQAFRASKTKK